MKESEKKQDNDLEEKHRENRQQRYEFILWWAEYVRSHPDEDWGEQVNQLVDSHLESAKHARRELD